MSDMTLLRIGIIAAGLLLLLAIVLIGRGRKPAQRRRADARPSAAGRLEPTLGEGGEAAAIDDGLDQATQPELGLRAGAAELGRRKIEGYDRIVSLYIAAKAEQTLHGPDIVVAAEKAGLSFGHMDVFHRLVDGKPELGPVFSVANILKPGSFDMGAISTLETPAITFFLTLPAPVGALEAWDMMLPAAQRMAELLDGVVLDEDRNALGRQRIAYIRDELRAYDRQHSVEPAGGDTRRF